MIWMIALSGFLHADYKQPYPTGKALTALEPNVCYQKGNGGYMLLDPKENAILAVRSDGQGPSVLKLPSTTRVLDLVLLGAPKWRIEKPAHVKVRRILTQGENTRVVLEGDVGDARVEQLPGNSGSVWGCLQYDRGPTFTIEAAERHGPFLAWVGSRLPGPLEVPELAPPPLHEVKDFYLMSIQNHGVPPGAKEVLWEVNARFASSAGTWRALRLSSFDFKKLGANWNHLVMDAQTYLDPRETPLPVYAFGKQVGVMASETLPSSYYVRRSQAKNYVLLSAPLAKEVDAAFAAGAAPVIASRAFAAGRAPKSFDVVQSARDHLIAQAKKDYQSKRTCSTMPFLEKPIDALFSGAIKLGLPIGIVLPLRQLLSPPRKASVTEVTAFPQGWEGLDGSRLIGARVRSGVCPENEKKPDPVVTWYRLRASGELFHPKSHETTSLYPLESADYDGDGRVEWLFFGGDEREGELTLLTADDQMLESLFAQAPSGVVNRYREN